MLPLKLSNKNNRNFHLVVTQFKLKIDFQVFVLKLFGRRMDLKMQRRRARSREFLCPFEIRRLCPLASKPPALVYASGTAR